MCYTAILNNIHTLRINVCVFGDNNNDEPTHQPKQSIIHFYLTHTLSHFSHYKYIFNAIRIKCNYSIRLDISEM